MEQKKKVKESDVYPPRGDMEMDPSNMRSSGAPKSSPRPKARPMKVPRPKPRPIMIGSNPETGATRGIDPRDNYSPEDLKRLLMQSAMERMETEGKSLASLRNRSSFDAQNRMQNKNKPTVKVVKPAQLDLFKTEAEGGDHKRAYKVVHAKKGVMDVVATSSYEAAKKFAKEKGLKSTAGVDAYLYPLEESKSEGDAWYIEQDARRMAEKDGKDWASMPYGYKESYRKKAAEMRKGDDEDDMYESAMSDLHARIMSSDDPHDEIYKMLTGSGPEAEYIQNMYNETSIDRGLHPDDDFEDIIDAMVAELDDDNPFEGVAHFHDEYDTKAKVEVTDDKLLYDGNDIEMYSWSTAKGMLTPEMYAKARSWDDVHAYLKSEEAKGNLQQAIANAFETNDEGITVEGYYVMPDIDKERYTEMPGLEGPFQTKSGKPIYYDPKEGSYYDRDTDMYLTYSEFKALDDPKPVTGRMKEEEFNIAPLTAPKRTKMSNRQNFRKNFSKRYMKLYPTSTVEGNSPHKKGTKKYKAHMAAMHANSVDLNKMRDALKLDESADANTVIAEYTRATLDHSYKTWKQVEEQIAFIRSFVKEDVDVNAVKVMLRKMHERENLDHKMLVKENINKLNQIVNNKKSMSIKFTDGDIKVDTTTAGVFLEVYNKQKQQKQEKIVEKIQTKAGFISMLEMMYKKIG